MGSIGVLVERLFRCVHTSHCRPILNYTDLLDSHKRTEICRGTARPASTVPERIGLEIDTPVVELN